jgi:hypothetical protein
MPLTVYSCVTYVPTFSRLRTQEDWAALHFVKAIKGTPLDGYGSIRLPCGDMVRVDRHTAQDAPLWFAAFAVSAVPWRDVLPCGFVPIPDAACSLAPDRPPRTLLLAEALASGLGADTAAVDILRWVRPMAPAHTADGSRDPQVLYGRLRLRSARSHFRHLRLVLVDDVFVTGAHLRAAAAFLRDSGADVSLAICAARATESAESASLFVPYVTALPDFVSDPDWLLPETYDGVEL